MKLETLKEAGYASPKNLKSLLQFFEEEEGLDGEDYKVFNVRDNFLARFSNVQGTTEVIRLEFLDHSPNDVIIMFSDSETESMPIQKAANELTIFACKKVY